MPKFNSWFVASRFFATSVFAGAALLSVASTARAHNVLHSFGKSGDGTVPSGPLTLLSPKHFCGVTGAGGTSNFGTVYCLTKQANNAFTETTLVSLGSQKNVGTGPFGKLALSDKNTLYGVTGGGGRHNHGTIFQVTIPSGPGASPRLRTLYSFGNVKNDGSQSSGGVVVGADGSLYGATKSGGAYRSGAVFKLMPPVAGTSLWTETIIHNFRGPEGNQPAGGLTMDAAGTLYGATTYGGSENRGVVYALTPPAAGGVEGNLSVLHNFGTAADDGAYPTGDLLRGPDGVIYGTTGGGGEAGNDKGIAFAMAPPSAGQQGWAVSALHEFGAAPADGIYPLGGLVRDSAGNLYGITRTQGSTAAILYRLTSGSRQTPWTETILYRFELNKAPVGFPGELILDTNGDGLLGTVSYDGEKGAGTVYRRLLP